MNLGGYFRVTPERLRRLRGIGLRLGFGVIVYVIAFYVAFPYHRIKEQVIALASMRNLDVEIASAGPALGMGLSFSDILVMTRPTGPGKPTRFKIDEAQVLISPLARLLGENAYSLSAETMGGDIDVDWQGSKAKGRMKVRSQDVAMSQVPGVKESINLPLGGTLDLSIDLAMPANKNAEATGSLTWICRGCAVGDGKAKLKVAGNPMLAEGLSLPQIRLGDFGGKVMFEKGQGKLQAVQARSADLDLSIDGEIRLADPLQFSTVDLYIRFKPSDALLKRADKVQLMLQLVESMGKRPDGAFGLRLTGSFNRLGPVQWAKSSPFTSAPGPGGPRPAALGGGPRPSLSGRPPPPSRPAYQPPPPVDPIRNPSANLPRYPTEAPPPPPQPVAPSEPATPGTGTAGAPTEAVMTPPGAAPSPAGRDAL